MTASKKERITQQAFGRCAVEPRDSVRVGAHRNAARTNARVGLEHVGRPVRFSAGWVLIRYRSTPTCQTLVNVIESPDANPVMVPPHEMLAKSMRPTEPVPCVADVKVPVTVVVTPPLANV